MLPQMALDVGAGQVLIAVTLLAVPVAAIAFARSGPAWRGIGKGPLSIEREPRPARRGGAEPPVDRALQEAEARQMLEAKAYRQRRRGEKDVDVEAELARALAAGAGGAAGAGDELRDEVRQLVIARNERRLRRGEPALDVEAETERQLSGL